MITYFNKIVKYAQSQSLKIYLVLVSLLLVFFGIGFSNVGLLPFKKMVDFVFFVGLVFIFALYRPGWAFLLFIVMIPLENINLAPENMGLAIRPYQLLAVLIIVAILIRALRKKSPVRFIKMFWIDWMLMVFVLSGFISAFFALEKNLAFKQSLVAASLVIIYFLVRVFVDNFSDLKKILTFLLSSSVVILTYGIWQNLRFRSGFNNFEVMPGRPNSTFTEADWLGIFLVFMIAVAYSMIYGCLCNLKQSEKKYNRIREDQKDVIMLKVMKFFDKLKATAIYGFLVLILIVLIISVVRSAWLGAGVVTILFLGLILKNKNWKISNWNWKQAGSVAFGILSSILIALGIIKFFTLSSFELFNRAQSTASGLEEITIACQPGFESELKLNYGSVISNINELSIYGCRHINLEEVLKEKEEGKNILKIFHPDPNIKMRENIYKKSWHEIKKSPFLGIGWGNIGEKLGTDEHGSLLNSSNIFLEVWLGGGLLGIIAWTILLGYIFFRALVYFYQGSQESRIISVFVILGFFAIFIPNLFNAGIFLGFLWVYLGIAVSLLSKKVQ